MKQLTLLSLAVLCAASSLPAATLYWDGADSTANPDGGTGTWDTATANWDDAATSGNAVAFSSGDDVVFGGTAGTVTNTTALTAGVATFNTAGYTLTTTANLTLAGLAGSAGFTKNGAGVLTLNGGANTYSGTVTVGGGTMTVTGSHATASAGWRVTASTLNFSSGSSINVAAGKSIYVGDNASNSAMNVSGTVTNAGTLQVGYRGTLTLNAGTDWTQSGAIIIVPGTTTSTGTTFTQNGGNFAYTGTSAIAINTSGGAGPASLNLNGGIFSTGMGFVKTTGAGGSSNINMNGGTLRLTADVAQLANLTGGAAPFNFTLSGTNNTINTNGFSTTLNRAVGGAGSLIKAGAGTLTLSGVNTYAGATTVNAGALAVSGTVLVNGANGVTVATGATLAVTGTLKLTSASASISVADADAFTASGTLDLNGLFDAYAGATYPLISGGAGKVAAGSSLTVTGYNNAANVATFDATTGSLVFTAVPEPSTYGLMGAGALAIAAFVRRRRQRAR